MFRVMLQVSLWNRLSAEATHRVRAVELLGSAGNVVALRSWDAWATAVNLASTVDCAQYDRASRACGEQNIHRMVGDPQGRSEISWLSPRTSVLGRIVTAMRGGTGEDHHSDVAAGSLAQSKTGSVHRGEVLLPNLQVQRTSQRNRTESMNSSASRTGPGRRVRRHSHVCHPRP